MNTLLYIDPAATSVLLSSITAIVIAIGASAIVIWRKVKKKFKKTFKIDENAGKEVEDKIVLTEEETTDKKQEKVESDKVEKAEVENNKENNKVENNEENKQ